eukprot:361579-Chlamydomonas_euryale.AAC.8
MMLSAESISCIKAPPCRIAWSLQAGDPSLVRNGGGSRVGCAYAPAIHNKNCQRHAPFWYRSLWIKRSGVAAPAYSFASQCRWCGIKSVGAPVAAPRPPVAAACDVS